MPLNSLGTWHGRTANLAALRLTPTVSVSLWLMFHAAEDATQRAPWSFGANDGYLMAGNNGTHFGWYVRDTAGPTWRSISETGAWTTEIWYHYIGTCTTNSLAFYKNGTSIGTGSTLTGINYPAATLMSHGHYNSGKLNYSIAEFSIYNKVLSADERAWLDSPLCKSPLQISGLIAYWPFEDFNVGEGTANRVVREKSGNGYDITTQTGENGQGQSGRFTYP